jgi:oxygen-independent coproporphyrinogen III oxidase
VESWSLAALPPHLKRNSLDYYYLSVWPGLRALDPIESVALPPRPAVTGSMYVHIPFCSGLCDFCSYFLKVVRAQDDPALEEHVDDLLREVDIHKRDSTLEISYLYVGGGTPSILHPDQLDRLLSSLHDMSVLAPSLTGTIEVHPELFSDEVRARSFLDVLERNGLRRVSIGFETDDTTLLEATNRRHDDAFLPRAITLLHERGFVVNVDLMYGLPGQALASWIRSLGAAVATRPDSISTYFTFVDEGTPLWKAYHRGEIRLPEHVEVQAQHVAAQNVLEEAGYSELPNDFYSRLDPGQTYRQESLPSDANSLALGPGSYGYYSGVQYFNEFDFEAYRRKVRAGRPPLWRGARLSPAEIFSRDVMFSFKNAPELDGDLFRARHGRAPWDEYPETFAELQRLELVDVTPTSAVLTSKGRLLVEEIACLFAVERPPSQAPARAAERRRMRKHNFAPTYARLRAPA